MCALGRRGGGDGRCHHIVSTCSEATCHLPQILGAMLLLHMYQVLHKCSCPQLSGRPGQDWQNLAAFCIHVESPWCSLSCHQARSLRPQAPSVDSGGLFAAPHCARIICLGPVFLSSCEAGTHSWDLAARTRSHIAARIRSRPAASVQATRLEGPAHHLHSDSGTWPRAHTNWSHGLCWRVGCARLSMLTGQLASCDAQGHA